MKKLLLFTFTFCNLNSFSQSPAWLWAHRPGAPGVGTSITTDANDNIYLTGTFSGAPFIFGNDTITPTGGVEIFIAKYDAAGNEIWARGPACTGNENVTSISTDLSGNVYITGTFSSTSAITFGSNTFASAGAYDIFIAKYDSAGNVLWAHRAGGTNFEYSADVAADAGSNVYLTGRFSSTSITFGSITLMDQSVGNDIFLVKYDSAGNVLWARSDVGDDYRGIGFDSGGNIFLAGVYSAPSMTYGSFVLNNADVTGSTVDIFVAKHDSAGNILRAWDAGGTDNDGTEGISVTGNGQVYIVGGFTSNTITFGSTTLTNTSSYDDILVAKFDSSGNALWAKRAGGTYNQWCRAISTDAAGNAYVTGYFQSATCTFGSTVLTNAGSSNEDIFLAKYDAAGNLIWAISAGGVPDDNPSAVIANAAGNVCITGSFHSPSISFGTTTLSNPGGAYPFVAKLDFTTGITGQHNDNRINIYPNPATNEIRVQSSELKVESVEVFDVLGKKVLTEQAQTFSIDVSKLNSGIYFVEVRSEKITVRKKIVKM